MRASQLKQLFHKEEIVRMYEPRPNENINDTARRMVDLAKRLREPVMATIDSVELTASPSDQPTAVIRRQKAELRGD